MFQNSSGDLHQDCVIYSVTLKILHYLKESQHKPSKRRENPEIFDHLATDKQ